MRVAVPVGSGVSPHPHPWWLSRVCGNRSKFDEAIDDRLFLLRRILQKREGAMQFS
jgi:hypothetical protein